VLFHVLEVFVGELFDDFCDFVVDVWEFFFDLLEEGFEVVGFDVFLNVLLVCGGKLGDEGNYESVIKLWLEFFDSFFDKNRIGLPCGFYEVEKEVVECFHGCGRCKIFPLFLTPLSFNPSVLWTSPLIRGEK